MDHWSGSQPMGILRLLTMALWLWRRSFWLLLGIVLVFEGVATLPVGRHPGWGFAAALPAQWMLGNLMLAAFTYAVSHRLVGDPKGLRDSYLYAVRALIPLTLTTALAGLLIVGGVFLLIVGAFVFALWTNFTVMVFVVEGKRYTSAIRRSKYLVGDGVWVRVLLVGLVGVPLGILPADALTHLIQALLRESHTLSWVLVWVWQAAWMTLTMSLVLSVNMAIYLDARVRRDGFGPETLAQELLVRRG